MKFLNLLKGKFKNGRKTYSVTRNGLTEIEFINSQKTPREDVLNILAERGDLTIQEIAKELDKSPNRVAAVVNELIKEGLIA